MQQPTNSGGNFGINRWCLTSLNGCQAPIVKFYDLAFFLLCRMIIVAPTINNNSPMPIRLYILVVVFGRLPLLVLVVGDCLSFVWPPVWLLFPWFCFLDGFSLFVSEPVVPESGVPSLEPSGVLPGSVVPTQFLLGVVSLNF